VKIVDLKTFLDMPEGTIFAKYQPSCFEGLQIMGGRSGERDFIYMPLGDVWFEGCDDSGAYFDMLDAMEAGVSSPPIDYEMYGRDALFEEKQLFAVWEKRDVEALIGVLTDALGKAYE